MGTIFYVGTHEDLIYVYKGVPVVALKSSTKMGPKEDETGQR